MSEKFTSKMEWEVWEAFTAEYPYDIIPPLRPSYLQVIDDAKKNRIPFGELGEVYCPYQRIAEVAVNKLLLLVPHSEKQVLLGKGWRGAIDARPADYLAYRLIPEWQPPEKPKELVGEEWLRSLPYGTVVYRKDRNSYFFVTDNILLVRNEKASPGGIMFWDDLQDTSPKNSTIIREEKS